MTANVAALLYLVSGVLFIMALVCGALLVSGAISIYFSYQQNKDALSLIQQEKAVAAAARIEQFIERIDQQLSYASLPQLGAGGIEERGLGDEAHLVDPARQQARQVRQVRPATPAC